MTTSSKTNKEIKRVCDWCGKDISDKQKTAKSCCKLHRNYWYNTFNPKGRDYRIKRSKKDNDKFRKLFPQYHKEWFEKKILKAKEAGRKEVIDELVEYFEYMSYDDDGCESEDCHFQMGVDSIHNKLEELQSK